LAWSGGRSIAWHAGLCPAAVLTILVAQHLRVQTTSR
jgi:hypothetical protein